MSVDLYHIPPRSGLIVKMRQDDCKSQRSGGLEQTVLSGHDKIVVVTNSQQLWLPVLDQVSPQSSLERWGLVRLYPYSCGADDLKASRGGDRCL